MRLFRKREDQDEKLIRNIERYEKEKAKRNLNLYEEQGKVKDLSVIVNGERYNII